MTQWYPKMAEYDAGGWHLDPYIGREFYGVFGEYNVNITIPSEFVLGGTGNILNPNEVGCGYETSGQVSSEAKTFKTWKFEAKKVHDFAWAADRDYVHDKIQVKNGPVMHFLYQKDENIKYWDSLKTYAAGCMEYMSKAVGNYPFKQFSVIQGGDGGMEYPMMTLITSKGSSFQGLVSVTVHEMIHSWFPMVLATNEARYPWMDEGFTTYYQYQVMNKLLKWYKINPLESNYASYYRLNKYGLDEPLTTHADHYHTNAAYGTASYSKGAMFLNQLKYIVGPDDFDRGMKTYFRKWKFRHPKPENFIRVMEKVSQMKLDWYLIHWIGTTNKIDYSIKQVSPDGNKTKIILERIGDMPMPIDILVKTNGGTKRFVNIPLLIMFGNKDSYSYPSLTIEKPWPWVYPFYEFTINEKFGNIESITIDPDGNMADIDKDNNTFPIDKTLLKNSTN